LKNRPFSLNLVSKALLSIGGLLAVLAAGHAAFNMVSFRAMTADINETRIYDRIRIFAHAVERAVPGAKVQFSAPDRVSRVVIPAMPPDNDTSIVDAAGDQYGASLNKRDITTGEIIRLTSSVFGPDGQRVKGQKIPGNSPIGAGLARGEVVISPIVVGGIPRLGIYAPLALPTGEIIGAISSGIPLSQALALDELAVHKTIIGTILFLVLGAAAIIVSLNVLLRPLAGLSAAIVSLSQDKAIDVSRYVKRRDELGSMAVALGTLGDRLAERRTMQDDILNRAEQDVAKRSAMTSAVESFGGKIGTILSRVQDRSGQVLDATATVRELGRNAAHSAAETSSATRDTADRMGRIAAAAEELNLSISEIRRQTMSASDISEKAAHAATDTSGNVSELIGAADKIGHVVALIRAIAEQTNLLALNATIEAARAGDAGRGFAVVASEVKQLASQTASATEDISGQVAAIQRATTETADAMQGISRTIDELRNATAAISAAVEQQTGATSEIAAGVEDAVHLALQASEAVAEVTSRVGATEDSAISLDQVSTGLKADIIDVQAAVSSFLGEVKAA
jgi:methyl-accepting chemotaxis protein